ncbi:hypothetical protein N9E09_01175 [bacterium]|jgi:hypothetical protein|nr:hypothetical protein [bacterium]
MSKIKDWFITILMDQKSKEKYLIEKAPDNDSKKRKLLDYNLKHSNITQDEFDKQTATLDGEPYIRVVNLEMDSKSPSAGYFELDFNENFVEYLADSGYEGVEPDEIVDNWFNDLCQNIVMEGLEDSDGITKSVDTKSKQGLIIQKLKTDNDDTVEYS